MSAKLKKHLAVLPALGLFIAGCGSESEQGVPFRVTTGTQDSSQQALVQGLTPLSAEASVSMQASGGTALTLTQARVNLRDIRLELEKGVTCESVQAQLVAPARCKSEGESSHTIQLEGPFVIDLMAGTSTPDLSAARVPAGIYRRIDFRLDDAEENVAEGDALRDNSFVARASFEHDGAAHELALALKFNEDHRVESAAGIEVKGEDAELLLMLQPSEWLKDIPLAECLESGSLSVEAGVVRLDERSDGSCSGVENTLKRNIKTSAAFKGSAEVKAED